MELALLCTFFSMVQLIKYKHSLLIKFLTYQITNLMEIQWNVCCSFVKLAEYNQNPKGRCPLQGSLPILLNACTDRRIPFQTLQTLLSVKSFRALAQISLKKYLSSLSSLSADHLQNSLKETLFKHPPFLSTDALYPRRDFLFRISILQSESVLA